MEAHSRPVSRVSSHPRFASMNRAHGIQLFSHDLSLRDVDGRPCAASHFLPGFLIGNAALLTIFLPAPFLHGPYLCARRSLGSGAWHVTMHRRMQTEGAMSAPLCKVLVRNDQERGNCKLPHMPEAKRPVHLTGQMLSAPVSIEFYSQGGFLVTPTSCIMQDIINSLRVPGRS